MPSVGHLLAARSTAPHCAGITGRREHIVIGHRMVAGTVATSSTSAAAASSASTSAAGDSAQAARRAGPMQWRHVQRMVMMLRMLVMMMMVQERCGVDKVSGQQRDSGADW